MQLLWSKATKVKHIEESLKKSGATIFLSVSHLVQMDARVNSGFGLVALEVGIHSLFTHAHSGKHLSNLLQHKENMQ